MSWGSLSHRLSIPALLAAISVILVAFPTTAAPAGDAGHRYRLITFADSGGRGLGARISGPADADRRLHGTPERFRRYVGAEGLAAAAHPGTCDAADAAVYVLAYTTDHFAAGAGSPCGGRWGNARVILGKRHHHWRVLLATQDAWDCGGLRRYAVPGRLVEAAPAPADATHNCYDSVKHRPGHYRHR